ncbi:MAG: 23S rRNA (adenine(2503)-C(2))-methyltransferase RlmN [Anaerolineae bacterium]|nr:23S rRNA (adenine(2503)-C(2))-methyltransferase RlmN [Anaerolineae bacterium]
MIDTTNLYDLTHEELVDLLAAWGEPRYRADQLWQWLYQHKATDFASMHTLPAALRDSLAAETRIGGAEVVRKLSSADGETRKYLLQLADGQMIETVLMQYSGVRRTACISTQAGCAMGCVFCATGQMGFARHLTAGEIIEQAVHVARILETEGERLSNVVLMGMGEPFHNYDPTLEAIRRLIDPATMGIGQRHVTVSTIGLVPAIRRFAQEGLQVRLAISLHAATDEERSALLPVNRRYPLDELLAAVRDYIDQTGRRVTFEWALIEGENDSAEEAHRLGKLLKGLLCHLNVIPLNPTGGYRGRPSKPARVDRFVQTVKSYGIPTTVRVRRGIDIHAGCGQLKAAVIEDGG